MKTKKCEGEYACSLTKSIRSFYKDKRYKDGRQQLCKLCQSKYGKKWRTENPEKTIKRKIYYENYLNTLKGRTYQSYWRLKAKCKKNKIDFNLTKEWFYEKRKKVFVKYQELNLI